MDLEELKEDMIALRAEATALVPAVGETLAHIAELLLKAEEVAQRLHASGQAARAELTELDVERVSWETQAGTSREEVVAAMQALDAALDEQLPLLETARLELAKALQETSASAQTLEHDITAGAPKVAEAEKSAVTGLGALGAAGQHSEDELKQGVESARREAEQLGDRIESGAGELVGDLDELRTTVETLARQAEATVANVGHELGQRVEELTDAVIEAAATTASGHDATVNELYAAITARADEWRQATQEAVDATDQLVHDVDAARQQIEQSAGAVDTSSAGLSQLDGILDTVTQQVRDAAATAGLEWVR